MGTIGIKEAFEQGTKAYHQGLDIMNIPGYLSDLERENWLAGYEEQMYFQSTDDYEELDGDYIGLNGESSSYPEENEQDDFN